MPVSSIDLFNVLRHIPDVTEGQAKAAADSAAMASEVVTKIDLVEMEARLDGRISGLETNMGKMEDRLDGRISGLETNMGKMEAGLKADMGKMEAKLDGRISELEIRMTNKFIGGVGLILATMFGLKFFV